MALFDSEMGTLEDALGQRADNQVNSIQNQFAKKRRQSVAEQAKLGRLGSGVSNYQAGDLDAAQVGEMGDVYDELASALGEVPMADYASTMDNQRKRQLAELIGKLSQREKNPLLGALSGGAQGASTGSAFGPYGAVIGGVAGAGLGAYGES